MSTEPHNAPTEQPSSQRSKNRPALFAYMVALFAVAFLLLVMSYFMQQRRNDQQVIEGLTQNSSALQITRSVQEQNETLREEVATLQQTNEELTSQLEDERKTTLALDWLWRIEREFFQKRHSSARQMIRDFEATGLKAYLPTKSLTDPEYRSPLEQYESIYDLLF